MSKTKCLNTVNWIALVLLSPLVFLVVIGCLFRVVIVDFFKKD